MKIPFSAIGTLSDEPPWLVHNLVSGGYLVVLAGLPGVGKSYFSYAMALAIASGNPFLGRAVKQGPILYFDEENGDDAKRYVREIAAGMPAIDPAALDSSFHWYQDELASHTVESRYDKMISLAATIHPRLIVVDTAKGLGIADENDNAEANRHIEGLGAVRRAAGPDATLVLLKHARVDPISGERSIRGAKAWIGSFNAAWCLYRKRGRPKMLTMTPTILEAVKARAGSFKDPMNILPTVKDYGLETQSVSLACSPYVED